MAFQTPITIQDAVERIRRKQYVLPAIQREFVWSPAQIIRLFDSILRGYPIGSFLFWKVDKNHCGTYRFYEFLDRYHQRDRKHNPDADLTGDDSVTAVLDGQQRLTSLYLGLRGSYAYKTKSKRWTSDAAFPERRLYLNLAAPLDESDVELKYDLRFLTDAETSEEGQAWFRVGKVLEFKELGDVFDYLRVANLLAGDRYPQECLVKLFEVVNKNPLVNYYLEGDQDLDKVLNVFIRVNSGGTPLSYSDLLLSIATAQWDRLDARTAIHGLVDELNRTGEGFNLDKDFILKSSLVLSDLQDIAFKVKNFNQANMSLIEQKWEDISGALTMAVQLAARFGYSAQTLSANNVLIPVAYYLLRRELPAGYLERNEHAVDRAAVRNWMARALLKTGTFGAGLDTTLRTARNALREHDGAFPLAEIDSAFARIGRGLRFEEEEIEDLLDREYGRRQTFSVLALLYPTLDFNNRFHVDHIFPKSRFAKRRLRTAGVADDQIDGFIERVDKIANLQLLEGIPNQEKSNKMPAAWVAGHFRDDAGIAAWKERNYVQDLPEEMPKFLEFYEARRTRMRDALFAALNVKG